MASSASASQRRPYSWTTSLGSLGENLVNGAINAFIGISVEQRSAIIQKIKEVFNETFLNKAPHDYKNLQIQLQSLKKNPTKEGYREARDLLKRIDKEGLQKLDPKISQEKVDHIFNLRTSLKTPTPQTKQDVKEAEKSLSASLKNYEGILISSLDTFVKPGGGLDKIKDKLIRTSIEELNDTFNSLNDCKANLKNPKNLKTHLKAFLKNWKKLQKKNIKELTPRNKKTLNTFAQVVQGVLDKPKFLAKASDWLQDIEEARKALKSAIEAQKGVFQQIKDSFSDIISLDATPKAAAPKGGKVGIDYIKEKGGELFEAITASAGTAISISAAKQLGTAMIFVFEKIEQHIEGDKKHEYLIKKIKPLKERIQKAKKNGDWAGLNEVLRKTFGFIREQEVFLQGMRLPINPVRSTASPIPDFLKVIEKHRAALHPSSHHDKATASPEMIQRQANLLMARAASVGPATFILENVCGIKMSNDDYATIFTANSAIPVKNLPGIFRQRLIDKLEEANLSYFRVTLATFLYDHLLLPVSSFYTKAILQNGLKFVQNWQTFDDGSLAQKELQILQLIRNSLAILSGAYNEVANAPPAQSKDFFEMMDDALKSPQRNGGLSQQELYASTIKTLISMFGPKIEWRERATSFLKGAEISNESQLSFLNYPLQAMNYLSSALANMLLFLPQWACNYAMTETAKFSINFAPDLEKLMADRLEALRHNTPTSFAMHQLIYTQAQKVLENLKKQFNKESIGDLRDKDTNLKNMEIAGLIEYGHELLKKSGYRTQDRLAKYLKGKHGWKARIEDQLEEAFLPEALDTLITTISVSMKAVMNQEAMQDILFNGLCIANDSFEAPPKVSEKDLVSIQKGIRQLTGEILEASVFQLITEKSDYTREKEKKGVRNFFKTLINSTKKFSHSLQELSHELNGKACKNPNKLLSKVTTMVNTSQKFHKKHLDALFSAVGNHDFHSETKSKLNALYKDLIAQSKPLASKLNAMKKWADQATNADKYKEKIKRSQKIAAFFTKKDNLSRDMAIDMMSELQRIAQFLKENGAPKSMSDLVEKTHEKINTHLLKYKELEKTEESLAKIGESFRNLSQEKLKDLNSNRSDLRNLEKEMIAEIQLLPNAKKAKELQDSIRSFMSARTDSGAKQERKKFLEVQSSYYEGVKHGKNARTPKIKDCAHKFDDRLDDEMTNCSTLTIKNRKKIFEMNTHLTKEAPEISKWVKKQRAFAIWTLYIVDMHWLTDIAKNVAGDLVESKVRQIFASVYQPFNFSSFLSSAVMVPLLRKYGTQYLKERK